MHNPSQNLTKTLGAKKWRRIGIIGFLILLLWVVGYGISERVSIQQEYCLYMDHDEALACKFRIFSRPKIVAFATREEFEEYFPLENQIFDIIDHWHYGREYIAGGIHGAQFLNPERFNVWSEKVLLAGTGGYSEDIISQVLHYSDQAPSLIEKYPQILKYQTDASPDIRCGFSRFIETLAKQRALDLLHTMESTETDTNTKACIEGNIQWRMGMN